MTQNTNPKIVFQSAPLLLPILAFLVGIVWGSQAADTIAPAILLVSLSLAGFVFCRRRFPWARYCLLTLACGAGMIHHYRVNRSVPADHLHCYLQRIPLDELSKVDIAATIVRPPVIHQPEKTFPYHTTPDLRTQFLVDADHLNIGGRSFPMTGLITVSMPGMRDRYQPGQRVELTGRLVKRQPYHSGLPCLNRRSSPKHNGISARLFVAGPNHAKIITDSSFSWPALKHRFQSWARNCLLGDDLPSGPYTRDLLTAVILGKKNMTENALNQSLIRIGSAHFLAVSGFHLFVLSLGIWFLCAAVGVSRRHRAFLVIGCALAYATITDFRPSVTRATIMTIALCGGIVLHRPSNALNALALAAGIILLINPNQLFQPGFQLSFVAALGLIRLSKPIYVAIFTRHVPADVNPPTSSVRITWQLFIEKSKLLFAVSIAAALAASPLAMVHFNRLSLIGPVGSVLIYPLATLLTLTGFLQLLLGMVCPVFTPPVSWLTNLISTTMAKLSLFLGSLPGVAFDVPTPAWSLIIAYLALLFLPTLRFRKCLILLIVIFYLSSWLVHADPDNAWIYAAGPAEGRTTVVNTGRELVLINCGGYRTGQTAELTRKLAGDFLAEPMLTFCSVPDEHYFNDVWTQAAHYPRMDFLIPTGFKQVAKTNEPVSTLIRDETLHRRFLAPGATVTLNATQVQLLWPPDPAQTCLPRELFKSGAVLVTQKGHRVLIASDLSDVACQLIETNYPGLRVDTLLLSGAAPLNSLETWIPRAGIRQIAVQGRCHPCLEGIAARQNCKLLTVPSAGGFLVNKP